MRVVAANRRSLATFLLCKWAIDWCRNAYSKEDRKTFGCKGDWSYQKQDVPMEGGLISFQCPRSFIDGCCPHMDHLAPASRLGVLERRA